MKGKSDRYDTRKKGNQIFSDGRSQKRVNQKRDLEDNPRKWKKRKK